MLWKRFSKCLTMIQKKKIEYNKNIGSILNLVKLQNCECLQVVCFIFKRDPLLIYVKSPMFIKSGRKLANI